MTRIMKMRNALYEENCTDYWSGYVEVTVSWASNSRNLHCSPLHKIPELSVKVRFK